MRIQKSTKKDTLSLDEEIVLVCAFRYALGRITYVVKAVVDTIHQNWDRLSLSQRNLIVKEILEQKNKFGIEGLGMKCDQDEWLSIVDRYNQEHENECES